MCACGFCAPSAVSKHAIISMFTPGLYIRGYVYSNERAERATSLKVESEETVEE